ncbi:class I SAM-dependent methyltransferase [Spongiivirga citrea]|uniref:Class I SAM-dependent methyltransferase n=1 Tax=Spongiivirga citrea TaxID=1481457 RepID=A0A6M0CSZ9_9FLAO|nr:class I SAM-dependent methyltransferase [Spongiivirga citrea]NER19049.1 class I SAM-dependent methyltransferase [Spongiivirga citrea]
MKDIYKPEFIASLFDDMSKTYKNVNFITSFGFSDRWRRQCVAKGNIIKGDVVVDLMTGMGECWPFILKGVNRENKVIALDISSEMIRLGKVKKQDQGYINIDLLQEDIFKNSIEDNSADVIISGFGLKTFNELQMKNFALEVKRILKPGGTFSLVDVSIPNNTALKSLYLFYIKYCIPFFGKLFLGNPETYKMLGIYTEHFKNAKRAAEIFKASGLKAQYVNYFYGCATGISGCN